MKPSSSFADTAGNWFNLFQQLGQHPVLTAWVYNISKKYEINLIYCGPTIEQHQTRFPHATIFAEWADVGGVSWCIMLIS